MTEKQFKVIYILLTIIISAIGMQIGITLAAIFGGLL